MATKKKAAKKRAPKLFVPGFADHGTTFDTFVNVLRAAGSATTAPTSTLAALLAAARGIELVLASRPEPDGQNITNIGLAHSLVAAIPNESLVIATEAIIREWTYPPTVATKPRRDSKKRVAPKRRART
jgi:hypothetical protein